jgi:hypothetical protein
VLLDILHHDVHDAASRQVNEVVGVRLHIRKRPLKTGVGMSAGFSR